MRKIVLLVALCLGIGNAFAQDVDKLRDEGDAALKAKPAWEKMSWESRAAIFLKAADLLANQAKQYAEAAKFFDMAVKYKYNLDDSYVGEAMAYRNLGKNEEFFATVDAGLKELPGNANLEKLLYTQSIKLGQAAQKKGDIKTAEELYKKVLGVSNKKYQENALYSLGAMLYNQGATTLVKINPLATSEPDKYKAEKGKADTQLKSAKEYLDKALALNPANENAKKLVDAIAASLK